MLGQDFAEEAQHWVALTARLADDLKASKEETAMMREVRLHLHSCQASPCIATTYRLFALVFGEG